MGCRHSFLRGERSVSSQPRGDVITVADDLEVGDADEVDYAVGFDAQACREFTVGYVQKSQKAKKEPLRALRVSSLSGQVTLYLAKGEASKATSASSASRLCPRADQQPSYCSRCPFCPGNELKTLPEVLVFDEDGDDVPPGQSSAGEWLVRVFPNSSPTLICPQDFYRSEQRDFGESVVAMDVSSEVENPTVMQVDARGVSEVVVESSVHNALLALQPPSHIQILLRALVSRAKVLSQQPWAKQLLFFKQYGPLSGGSLVHPHMHIASLPVISPILLASTLRRLMGVAPCASLLWIPSSSRLWAGLGFQRRPAIAWCTSPTTSWSRCPMRRAASTA